MQAQSEKENRTTAALDRAIERIELSTRRSVNRVRKDFARAMLREPRRLSAIAPLLCDMGPTEGLIFLGAAMKVERVFAQAGRRAFMDPRPLNIQAAMLAFRYRRRFVRVSKRQPAPVVSIRRAA